MLSGSRDGATKHRRSFAELVPYATMLSDGIVLLKDGSLLVAFRLQAVELDDLLEHERVKVDQALQQALRRLSPQYTMWTRMRKRIAIDALGGQFREPAAQHIDTKYNEQFTSTTSFAIERHVALVLSPSTGWAGFRERMTRHLRAGTGLISAIGRSIRDGLGTQRLLGQVVERFAELQEEIELTSAAFASTAGVGLARLKGDRLRGFLLSCTSPTVANRSVKEPDRWQFLDGYLTADTLVADRDHLEFTGTSGRRMMVALALKEWPEETAPGVMNGLLAVPCEFVLSQAFEVSSAASARSRIRAMQLFYLNTRRDLRQAIAEYLTKQASEMRNEEKEASARDAASAMATLGTTGHFFGDHTCHILVEGADWAAVDAGVRMVSEQLEARRFVVVRESVGQVTAFAGTIPGARSKLIRKGFVSSGNVAAMLPVYGPGGGNATDRYFTEMLGSPQPALIRMQTPYHVPYAWNMHNASDAAHVLVVGPTRTGKTVLALLIAAQFEKYGGNFVGFDMDRSMKVFAYAHNIAYTDPAEGTVQVNPLGLLGTDDGHLGFLVPWVVGLLESRGSLLTSGQVTKVLEALKRLRAVGPSVYRLSGLASQLDSDLRERLAPWLDPGGAGKYFDNEADSFRITGRMAIELGSWLGNEEVAGPMLDYLFYQVSRVAAESMNTRKPTFIYIPEVWFALKNPRFGARIEEWLKTMAKKLCCVVMDTQSIEDVAKGDSFASFRSNVPNLIFSADARAAANMDFFKRNFALTELQVDLISRGLPRRSYLLVEGTQARLLDVQVPPSALAFLRSDPVALQALGSALSQVGSVSDDGWRHEYLRILNN